MVSGEWRVQNFCGQMCSGFQSGNNNHTSTDTEVFWHSGALQIGLLLLLLLWTMTGLRSKLTQWLQREETSLPLCWVPYATIHTLSFYLPSLHSVVAPGWVSSLKKRTFVNNWSRFFLHSRCCSCHPAISITAHKGTCNTDSNQGKCMLNHCLQWYKWVLTNLDHDIVVFQKSKKSLILAHKKFGQILISPKIALNLTSADTP